MKLSMYVKMQKYAKNFAPDREDVQAYWNTPPGLLLDTSKTTKNEKIEDEKDDLVPIQVHDISFGSYIDACSYGNDLALFLEGRKVHESMNSEGVNLACAVESTTTFDQDAGYESDHINVDGPEDCGHSDDVHSEGGSMHEHQSILMTANRSEMDFVSSTNLTRYKLEKSIFMTSSRSSYTTTPCKGSIASLSTAQFRDEVSGVTSRIKLCKEHGLSYVGGKQKQILNLLGHYCEFHGWGDTDLDEVNDLFNPRK